ncbi:MAG: hypothetical protein R3C42_06220 [Parvularculaceae bacterium]|nr:hypothetical protein [Parvularculaceae bacterium]
MKRNAGAQASESKLENRFAALTSGLLARKGSAAPSNSPIEDPAEETVAFTLEPTRKAMKEKDAAAAQPKGQSSNAQKPAPAKSAPAKSAQEKTAPAEPTQKPESAPKKAAKKDEANKPAQKSAAAPPPEKSEPLVVINERSVEAGYPDNPSPEEIAALDAEADEVVSYFENFGSDDAVALEKSDFYGDDDDDDEEEFGDDEGADPEAGDGDVLDQIEDGAAIDDFGDDDNSDDIAGEGAGAPAPGGVAIAGPWAGASVPPVAPGAFEVKAGVTVQLTAREFMRLSLGAAELGETAQDLIVEAIEDYLDARGVLSLGGCSCLEALAKKPDGA